MDKNKLEISGRDSIESAPASYKPIPEKDMEEIAISRPKSLIKVKASPEEDGAHEKMLPGEEQVPEVVVYNNEKSPQNGDAKLDIADLKQALVGLTKEELMKYANDPFWVRLRWFLFITFWVLWAAMLLGAILIIYAAPKCDPPPPRTWYQQGPLSQLPQNSKPEIIKELDENIQGLIVSYSVDTYAPLEEYSDLLAFSKTAKEQGTNVIIELDPTVSNIWFEKSENKDPNYDDYYIWKSANSTSSPPNNWVNRDNITSWKFSKTRQEYYYSPFEIPHLNFRNRSVVEEFSKAIDKFLAVNISGIRLRNAAFLLVDPSFENEALDPGALPSLGITNYDFYKHSKTENLPDIAVLLKEWRSLIRNKTEDGPLMIADELEKVNSYKINETFVIDMPLQSRIFSRPILTVNQTANSLNQAFNIDNIEWPLWEAKTDAVPQDVLDIITYLLPGAPLVNVTEKVNTILFNLRNSPSVMRGICGIYQLQNNTVLAFIRVTPGNPGILVAVNPTEETAVVNLNKEIPPLAELQEVTIRHFSSNYNEIDFKDVGGKKEATAVPVSSKSAIVLEYVPKREE